MKLCGFNSFLPLAIFGEQSLKLLHAAHISNYSLVSQWYPNDFGRWKIIPAKYEQCPIHLPEACLIGSDREPHD